MQTAKKHAWESCVGDEIIIWLTFLVLSKHGVSPRVFFPARRLYIHLVSTKLSIPDVQVASPEKKVIPVVA